MDQNEKELTEAGFQDDGIITRSNLLIRGKYSSTLLENKLTVWSLKKAEPLPDGRSLAKITMSELRKVMNIKGNGLYDRIKSATYGLRGKYIFMEDRKKHRFEYVNLVEEAAFESGVLTVIFTIASARYMYDLKSNFTSISLDVLFSLESNYSYRLYEILKMEEHRIDTDDQAVMVGFGLSELKLMLNLIDLSEKKVERALMKGNYDADYIVNTLAGKDRKTYDDWNNMNKRVLKKAVNEINKKTDLKVSYSPVRTGRGGRIAAVNFFLTKNTEFTNALKGSDAMIESILGLSSAFSVNDAENLIRASGGDMERIGIAWEYVSSCAEVKNSVGLMVYLLKNGIQPPVPMIEGSNERYAMADRYLEDYNRSLEKPEKRKEFEEHAWTVFKRNERFQVYLSDVLSDTGMDLFSYEAIVPVADRVRSFSNWLNAGI